MVGPLVRLLLDKILQVEQGTDNMLPQLQHRLLLQEVLPRELPEEDQAEVLPRELQEEDQVQEEADHYH